MCYGRYDFVWHPTADLPVLVSFAESQDGQPHPRPTVAPPAQSVEPASAAVGAVALLARQAALPVVMASTPGPAAEEPPLLVATAQQPSSSIEIVSKHTIFPGKDYSNPYVRDFFRLNEYDADSVDRTTGQ